MRFIAFFLPVFAIVLVSPAVKAHCEDKPAVETASKGDGDAKPAPNQTKPAATKPHAGPAASTPAIVIPRQL
jgi:hypothetical protein